MTLRVGLGLAIDSPLPPEPKTSLVLASEKEKTRLQAEGRWELGVRFERYICDSGFGAWAECSTGNDRVKTHGSTPGQIDYTPYVAYAADICSTYGFEAHPFKERATRRLDVLSSFVMARELSDGALARQNSLGGNFFFSQAIAGGAAFEATILNGGAATSSVLALAHLEDALANCLRGQPGMIHATPSVLTLWARDYVIQRAPGDQARTLMDTIISADAGYSANGPGGYTGGPTGANAASSGNVWIYASDYVYTRLGDIDTYGGADVVGVTRNTNDVLTFAERTVAAYFPGCCLFAIKVDAPRHP